MVRAGVLIIPLSFFFFTTYGLSGIKLRDYGICS
nr:MAG TPA: hypothetical protein [Crassvirales sp.]